MTDPIADIGKEIDQLERESADFAAEFEKSFEVARGELNEMFASIDADIEGISALFENDAEVNAAAE
jgi:hypothetical protein